MSTELRAVVSLDAATELPEDIIQNVFHFRSAAVDVLDDCTEIGIALAAFYDDIQSIYSANTIMGTGTIEFFDLQDVSPRLPIYTTTFTLLAMGDGDALPTEIAICLSFQGVPISGVNQQRRRGRVYLGPLDTGVSTTAADLVTVTTTVMEQIAAAATVLSGAGDASTWQWGVFSPTTAGAPPWTEAELTAAHADVQDGWVDNAFDVQRRRGTKATARETFGV